MLPSFGLCADSDTFVVRGVAINEIAHSAVSAKANGLKKAQIHSISVLLARLSPRLAARDIASVDPIAIEKAVSGFELSNEVFDNNHYSAVVTYRFDPAAVQSLIAALPKVTQHMVMLIPVFYDKAGNLLLWESAWLETWTDIAAKFIVPPGTLEDIHSIPIATIRSKELNAVHAVASHYGVDEVVLVEAYEGNDEIVVLVDRPSFAQISKFHYHFSYDDYDGPMHLLKVIAKDVILRLEKILIREAPVSREADLQKNTKEAGLLKKSKGSARRLMVYYDNGGKRWSALLKALEPYSYSIDYVGTLGVLISIIDSQKSVNGASLLENLLEVDKNLLISDEGLLVIGRREDVRPAFLAMNGINPPNTTASSNR